jgi:hypothetical protein
VLEVYIPDVNMLRSKDALIVEQSAHGADEHKSRFPGSKPLHWRAIPCHLRDSSPFGGESLLPDCPMALILSLSANFSNG